MNDSPDQAPPPSETAAVPTPASGSVLHSWRNPWLILALLAMGIAVWQWVETRIRLAETQQQVAQRAAADPGQRGEKDEAHDIQLAAAHRGDEAQGVVTAGQQPHQVAAVVDDDVGVALERFA